MIEDDSKKSEIGWRYGALGCNALAEPLHLTLADAFRPRHSANCAPTTSLSALALWSPITMPDLSTLRW
jgi:hypothetical protein